MGDTVTTLVTSLGGGLIGGVFRLVPEIIGFFDKKNERAHEALMLDKQIEADKIRSDLRISEVNAQGSIDLDKTGLQALTEAIKAQGQMTGNKLIDGMNQSVRPVVTYLILLLYLGAKISGLYLLHKSGLPLSEVLVKGYGAEDMAMLSGILNFWFLDRVIRKQRGH